MEILNTLSQYANLINFALLITIIGWLFTLTQQYKEAIKEKFESKLASKDVEIQFLAERLALVNDQLKFQEKNSNQQIEKTQADLERTEKWYEREKAELIKKLSNVLDKEGITKEGLVMNIDTTALTSEIKATIVNVLKEITAFENKVAHDNIQEIDNPQHFLELAKGFSLSKQWLESAKNYDKYINHNPTDWEVHFLRGVAYVNSRKGNETNLAALRSYNEAIAFMPRNIDENVQARFFAYRGAVAKRLNRLDEAESDLLIAQKYATADYEVYDIKYNLAAVYAMQRKRSKMFDMLSELIGRPEMAHVRAHLKDYFSAFSKDEEFRELIRC